jgi:hypothetical protein
MAVEIISVFVANPKTSMKNYYQTLIYTKLQGDFLIYL